jgi:trehalose 6-phosphate synthase/phosphatase
MTAPININAILTAYQRATCRLIILDHDGTLAPFEMHPDMARPSVKAHSLIRFLANDAMNKVILTSGRDKENMDAFFGGIPATLMAEHGAYIKENGVWKATADRTADWIPRALKALNILKFKYEGSSVELKSLSLVWHYRAIAEKIKPIEKKQIEADLQLLGQHEDFLIYHNEYTIELRTKGIDKGSALSKWANTQSFDFIVAIGDSLTDEDAFKVLPEPAFTIRVGRSTTSAARFHVESQKEVLPFLQELAETKNFKHNTNSVLHN